MRRSLRACTLLLGLVTLAAPAGEGLRAAQGPPLLWEGRHGTHRLWLFGTIHVPDPRVLALPPVVAEAFAGSDRVVTEVPLDAAHQAELATALLLPEPRQLRDMIGAARFARLQARVEAAVAPKAPGLATVLGGVLNRLKPWAALAQLATLEFLPDMLAGRQALDARLYADAVAAGKRVGGLETVAEQAATFDAFTVEEQGTMLDEALDQLDAPGDAPTPRQLVDWYLAGDTTRLAGALAHGTSNAALARKFEIEVLVKRNHRMAARVDALRREAPSETTFVAVGALHLVGADNLPTLLQERGYTMTRVRP